jgi:hypothetical protein
LSVVIRLNGLRYSIIGPKLHLVVVFTRLDDYLSVSLGCSKSDNSVQPHSGFNVEWSVDVQSSSTFSRGISLVLGVKISNLPMLRKSLHMSRVRSVSDSSISTFFIFVLLNIKNLAFLIDEFAFVESE